MLVAWLMSLTVEPGTVAPFWSEMIPLTPPVEVCAEAVRHDNARQKSNDTAALNNLMALTSRYVRMPRAEANCRGACALQPRDARARLTVGNGTARRIARRLPPSPASLAVSTIGARNGSGRERQPGL